MIEKLELQKYLNMSNKGDQDIRLFQVDMMHKINELIDPLNAEKEHCTEDPLECPALKKFTVAEKVEKLCPHKIYGDCPICSKEKGEWCPICSEKGDIEGPVLCSKHGTGKPSAEKEDIREMCCSDTAGNPIPCNHKIPSVSGISESQLKEIIGRWYNDIANREHRNGEVMTEDLMELAHAIKEVLNV